MTNIPLRAKNIDSELVSKPLFKCACIKIADLLQYHCDGKGKKTCSSRVHSCILRNFIQNICEIKEKHSEKTD